MNRTILSLLSISISAACYATTSFEHYNQTPTIDTVVELPNGSIANTAALNEMMPLVRLGAEITHTKVTENVYFLGRDTYSPVIVETDEGLLVFGGLKIADEGGEYRDYIRKHISDKPIIALFYDHSHYVGGAKTLLDGDDAMTIGHEDLNDVVAANTGDGMAVTAIPEMQPHIAKRANIQFGAVFPATGPDATSVPGLPMGNETAFVPVTHPVHDGMKMTVGGVDVVMYHAITDTEDTLTFYLPQFETVIDNVVWPHHNMYTLRGDNHRDPEDWNRALRQIRDLNPKYVLCVGALTAKIQGKENIRETINAILDARSFVVDQSIRLTNLGLPADQIKNYVSLPQTLKDHPFVNNAYGQFDTFFEAIPTANHGYFSGKPDHLHTLPRPVFAENFIRMSGGENAVYDELDRAMKAGEFLWAQDLAMNLYYNAPSDQRARQAYADVLRILGQHSEGFIARNFYIAGALSLEGSELVTLSGTENHEWVVDHTADAVNHLRTRINPSRSQGLNGVLIFDIDGARHSLELRNSIAEFTANTNLTGEVIELDSETFADYYTGKVDAKSIATGNALKLLQAFDEAKTIPMFPYNWDHLK